MKDIKKVTAVYFSPAGTTKEIVSFAAKTIADELQIPLEIVSYTLPSEREKKYLFGEDELVIWGTPVYAGRIPNKTLDYVKDAINGKNTTMVPIVVYGNRNFDNALSELTGIMKDNGGRVLAGAAMVSRHVFSDKVAAGRPDEKDFDKLKMFCNEIVSKINKREDFEEIVVPGNEHPKEYYVPKKNDGTPAKFLKAKPVVDSAKCDGCKVCENVCPMGSITMDGGIPEFVGICIKCHACVRKCHVKAIRIEDFEFLSHVENIEKIAKEYREPLFVYAKTVTDEIRQ